MIQNKYDLSDFNFEKEYNIFLNLKDKVRDISYTDGKEQEKELYDIIKDIKDKSIFSPELKFYCNNWVYEYHFSTLRHNLLRHLTFSEKDRILEFGAGCGAITRQLGETGASVVAIEGTLARAKCAAARCSDLDNVQVYCSNFEDIIFKDKFDYVTLIGVWEYSSIFIKGLNPFIKCLSLAKSALKHDGKLIIAIENRLGLKYFGGLNEDHVDIPYFGIHDLYSVNTAKTFGKKEITELLRKSGFNGLEFQYPFPDYKLPNVIITEKGIVDTEFKPAELIRNLSCRNYSSPKKSLINEFLTWPVLYDNNLIDDLANSFLILCSLDEVNNNSNLLAVSYTLDRKKNYNTVTEFIRYKEEILTNKKCLSYISENDMKKASILKHYIGADKYIKGKTLQNFLLECICKNSFEKFSFLLKKWLLFLEENALRKDVKENFFEDRLDGRYVDCLPANLIIKEEQLFYIDREWSYDRVFTIKFLFLKFWYNFLQYHQNFLKINGFNFTDDDLFVKFAASFGLNYSLESLKHNYSLIENINRIVYDYNYDNNVDEDISIKQTNIKLSKRRKLYGYMKKIIKNE